MSKPQNMKPVDIRILLLKAEITQSELARELKVSQELVYQIIEGKSTSHRIREHIAKRLKIDIRRIWPDPYLVYGGPRKAGRPICGNGKAAA